MLPPLQNTRDRRLRARGAPDPARLQLGQLLRRHHPRLRLGNWRDCRAPVSGANVGAIR